MSAVRLSNRCVGLVTLLLSRASSLAPAWLRIGIVGVRHPDSAKESTRARAPYSNSGQLPSPTSSTLSRSAMSTSSPQPAATQRRASSVPNLREHQPASPQRIVPWDEPGSPAAVPASAAQAPSASEPQPALVPPAPPPVPAQPPQRPRRRRRERNGNHGGGGGGWRYWWRRASRFLGYGRGNEARKDTVCMSPFVSSACSQRSGHPRLHALLGLGTGAHFVISVARLSGPISHTDCCCDSPACRRCSHEQSSLRQRMGDQVLRQTPWSLGHRVVPPRPGRLCARCLHVSHKPQKVCTSTYDVFLSVFAELASPREGTRALTMSKLVEPGMQPARPLEQSTWETTARSEPRKPAKATRTRLSHNEVVP